MFSLFLAGLALAALVVWGPAPIAVWQQISTVSPTVWMLAAVGLAGSYCLRALRLHAEWHALIGVGWPECLRVAVFHTVAINLLPMRSGEASYPLMLKQRWKVPLLKGSLSLMWMRLQDISVVAIVSLLAFMPGPLLFRLLAASFAVLVAMFAWKVARPRIHQSVASSSAQTGTGVICRWWRDLAGRLAAASSESRGGGRAWAYCLAVWALKFSTLVALFSQLAGLPPAAALTGVLGGEFASALPVQPAMGAGTYEAGVVFGVAFTSTTGMPDNATIISAAIALHLFMLSMSLGTAILLFATDFRKHAGVPAHTSP